MNRRLFFIVLACSLCIMLTACGPSDEKVAQAQQKYAELVEIHNQVVEMHKDIDNDSMDDTLVRLREKISEVEAYDLTEMKDEEIDMLIQIMDTLIASYEDLSLELANIKGEEDAAVLVAIPLSITNQTSYSFVELKLYESGDAGIHENVLTGMGDFAAGETLTGLVVQRDINNTPWLFELQDENGNSYTFELAVEAYDEEGAKLTLSYDEEKEEVILNP